MIRIGLTPIRHEGRHLANFKIARNEGRNRCVDRAHAWVSELVGELTRRKIGAVVISSDGRTVEGIASERDVVRGLNEFGAAILNEPVRAIMTGDVHTSSPADTVDSLMATMTNHRIRHVPAVDQGVSSALSASATSSRLVWRNLSKIARRCELHRGAVARRPTCATWPQASSTNRRTVPSGLVAASVLYAVPCRCAIGPHASRRRSWPGVGEPGG